MNLRIILMLCLFSSCLGCGSPPGNPAVENNAAPARNLKAASSRVPRSVTRAAAVRLGTTFQPYDPAQKHTLQVHPIEIPDFPGSYAIWGGTGRNDAGHILLGACATWTKAAPVPSVRVYRFNPELNSLILSGDAVGMLQQLGLQREEELELNGEGKPVEPGQTGTKTVCREGQMKIHTKFIPMDDGWVYFASMDEWAENEDGSQLPHWGSHLWRMKPEDAQLGDTKWEHLASVPEALIALGGVGRHLFSLGYFGHVLYRYDTVTGDLKKKEIGSYRGHISRNFLTDVHGHAYVPRITELPTTAAANPKSKPEFKVELVELDSELNEIGATPLTHYTVTGDASSHGITGIAHLADESLAFTTADGFLYRVIPQTGKPAEVREVGWFHANGKAYAPSLHSLDGQRFLCGVTAKKEGQEFDWVVYDLETNESRHEPFPIRDDPAQNIKNLLLYGSITRDSQGNFYLVGNYMNPALKRELPICLQVSWVSEQP